MCIGWGGECIGRRGEEKLHHYIIFGTWSSLVHEKDLSYQPDKDDQNWKQKLQVFKIKKERLYLQYRYYFTEPFTYFLVGMTQKEREEGANYTLLTVRFITYQHCYQISHYSAPLLIHFDGRWLISLCVLYWWHRLQKITKTQVVGC